MASMRWLVRPLRRYPKTWGLIAVSLLSMLGVGSSQPFKADPAWVLNPTNIVPLPDLLYEDGPFSGPWTGDLQYIDGKWFAGDGRGGIWYSQDAIHWKAAEITQQGKPRSMQNAPVRSINRGANGTYLATFLGGGMLRFPLLEKLFGLHAGQRAPVARSTDGEQWDVRNVPYSCGIHFSATDGHGTWITQGCTDEVLISYDDALTWTVVKTGLPVRIQAHGYLNGFWVIAAGIGPKGGIYTSRDLRTWTRALDLPNGVEPKQTLLLNGRLVMVGTRQFIASSTNGMDWQIHYAVPSGGATLRAGIWHPKRGYILGGTGGTLMYSRNLEQWGCSKIGLGTRVTGMAVSATGDVIASTMPIFLLKLDRDRVDRGSGLATGCQ